MLEEVPHRPVEEHQYAQSAPVLGLRPAHVIGQIESEVRARAVTGHWVSEAVDPQRPVSGHQYLVVPET